MIPTKDQIEAAARVDVLKELFGDSSDEIKEREAKYFSEEVNDLIRIWSKGALWMQAEMEKLKEQWQREAWLESSKAGGCHVCLDNWIREQK